MGPGPYSDLGLLSEEGELDFESDVPDVSDFPEEPVESGEPDFSDVLPDPDASEVGAPDGPVVGLLLFRA